MSLFKVQNMMYLVFDTFHANSFADSHVLTLYSSLFIIIFNVFVKVSVQSSVTCVHSIFRILETLGRSLMLIKKSKGPRIDHCGMLVEMVTILDFAPLYSTYCSLLHNNY